MRIAAWFITCLSLAGVASSQTPASPQKKLTLDDYVQINDAYAYWASQAERYAGIMQRARALFPARRNTPLRELNISDDEIREVEAIKSEYLPRDYINISPVVTECPCEEGPTCTAQVYVTATARGRERGLQLSRMNQTWQVGVVQQWWLRFFAIIRQNTGNPYLDDYLYYKARNELYEEFPRCVGTLVPAEQPAAAQKPEPAR